MTMPEPSRDDLLDAAWEFVRLLVAAGYEPSPELVDIVSLWELDRAPDWYRIQ